MKKSSKLKRLLASAGVEFILEAHNGLSAKIVEEAGFSGIWASGLAMSAALGVRDNNEASWTQIMEVSEFMSDVTSIPILLDADTGFGNFNNVRRLVRKLEQREIAGICIEDKLFPKTNSFIGSEHQPLADVEEFCGKIKAAKDTPLDEDFCIVARTESFIVGMGLAEALERARRYADAGADAVLVHSKIDSFREVESFMRQWDHRCPVVIVPTKYHRTPTEAFEKAGVSLVIWANHLLRSNIKSMQGTAEKIFRERSLLSVEDEVASLDEVFRLQGVSELKSAEERYLPG